MFLLNLFDVKCLRQTAHVHIDTTVCMSSVRCTQNNHVLDSIRKNLEINVKDSVLCAYDVFGIEKERKNRESILLGKTQKEKKIAMPRDMRMV